MELLVEGSGRHAGYVSRKQIRIGIWSPESLGDVLFADTWKWSMCERPEQLLSVQKEGTRDG